MNASGPENKINALCAEKVMGWLILCENFPDDALVVLEKAACDEDYDMSRSKEEGYNISIYRGPGDSGWQKTLALAMCVCALKAVGVSEDEIQEAMK